MIEFVQLIIYTVTRASSKILHGILVVTLKSTRKIRTNRSKQPIYGVEIPQLSDQPELGKTFSWQRWSNPFTQMRAGFQKFHHIKNNYNTFLDYYTTSLGCYDTSQSLLGYNLLKIWDLDYERVWKQGSLNRYRDSYRYMYRSW